MIPHAVLYFTPEWEGPSGRAVQLALAQGDPHIYVQTRLREELTRR